MSSPQGREGMDGGHDLSLPSEASKQGKIGLAVTGPKVPASITFGLRRDDGSTTVSLNPRVSDGQKTGPSTRPSPGSLPRLSL